MRTINQDAFACLIFRLCAVARDSHDRERVQIFEKARSKASRKRPMVDSVQAVFFPTAIEEIFAPCCRSIIFLDLKLARSHSTFS
ncbi:hypothetical protein DOFOFD_07620 [Acetobacteraceae bacterium EV16P]|uniref:Secreted protein n=1 Tax=Sorlinia euscelidii TaxID=3081148 RepID=A0ABU7U2C6_9PROT